MIPVASWQRRPGQVAIPSERAETLPRQLLGLKVLAFCDYLSPDSSGGIERVAHEVYDRLAAWGCQMEVITSLPRHLRPPPSTSSLVIHDVPMLEMSRFLGGQSGVALGLSRLSNSVARGLQPNVLYANGIHFQSTIAAARLAARTRVPLVTTSHVGGLDYLPQPIRTLTRAYEATVGRYILTHSSRIISTSASSTIHLQSLGVSSHKVVLVQNGIDHTKFRPGQSQTDKRVPTLMFVGRHISNKGPQILMEALIKLRRDNVPFMADFLSDGPLRQTLERRAHEAGLDDAIRFLGHVPDVAQELRRADIVVRPSLTEGMPLSVLEAMATAVCVVASNIDGNRDVIRDGTDGVLVPANDAATLASTLADLINNPVRRNSLARAALEAARQYSWDRCAEETAAVLLEAARQGPGPGKR